MYIKKVLIVDDEPLLLSFIKETLKRMHMEAVEAQNGQIAIDLLQKEDFDLIITDMKMPQKNGLDVLKFAKEKNPSCPVIIITAFGTIDNAVEAMKMGASNYLIKPFSLEAVETLIFKTEEQISLITENKILKKEIAEAKKFNFVFESSQMSSILENIPKIAQSNASVFISGESGTGKEVIAHLIHHLSKREEKPFIKVNCAAISENLLESEFFGHEKGAFTGANEQKKGRFELAHLGSLLLDEITEIPLSLQPKLLRAIQELEFERVGGTKPLKVDVRFIATSNRNMQQTIAKNLFREDLFFRINVVPIHIPPLRERPNDIMPLANFFLERFCKENHKALKKFSPSSYEKLINYSWPGNVRELANIIERVVVMDFSTIIEKEHLYLDCDSNNKEEKNLFLEKPLHEIEKELILQRLKKEKANKSKTAKSLGISLRTLRNKLKSYQENPK